MRPRRDERRAPPRPTDTAGPRQRTAPAPASGSSVPSAARAATSARRSSPAPSSPARYRPARTFSPSPWTSRPEHIVVGQMIYQSLQSADPLQRLAPQRHGRPEAILPSHCARQQGAGQKVLVDLDRRRGCWGADARWTPPPGPFPKGQGEKASLLPRSRSALRRGPGGGVAPNTASSPTRSPAPAAPPPAAAGSPAPRAGPSRQSPARRASPPAAC